MAKKPATKSAPARKPAAKAKPAEAALIVMTKDGKTADVHPAEVMNYRAGGWVVKR